MSGEVEVAVVDGKEHTGWGSENLAFALILTLLPYGTHKSSGLLELQLLYLSNEAQ